MKVLPSNALFATLVELNSSFTAVVVQFLADRWQFILRVSTKFKNSGNQQFGDHEFLSFNNINLAFLMIVCLYSQHLGEYNAILMSTKKVTVRSWYSVTSLLKRRACGGSILNKTQIKLKKLSRIISRISKCFDKFSEYF